MFWPPAFNFTVKLFQIRASFGFLSVHPARTRGAGAQGRANLLRRETGRANFATTEWGADRQPRGLPKLFDPIFKTSVSRDVLASDI